MTWNVARLDELDRIPVGDTGLEWRPIRSRFGIEAFGINAYTAANVGDEIVEAHTEESLEHEEVYIVLSGRATFTLDGEEVDAPAGTIVHLPETATRRSAIAQEPGTTVLAVGAKPGEAYTPSAWESSFRAAHLAREGDSAAAIALMEERLARDTGDADAHYNLACFLSLGGERERSLEHLGRAIEIAPRFGEYAKTDRDFDPMRDDVTALTG
ncbi:MAG: TPR end-of-group domain-containing protein [Gaiellaceae bacterium]